MQVASNKVLSTTSIILESCHFSFMTIVVVYSSLIFYDGSRQPLARVRRINIQRNDEESDHPSVWTKVYLPSRRGRGGGVPSTTHAI